MMFRPEARNFVFAGGFLLTNRERPSVVHFEQRRLPGGWYFWSDDAVGTALAIAESGDFVLVRGEAVDLRHERADLDTLAVELLARLASSEADLFARLDVVGGRYVVIFRKNARLLVCNDALGMRSVYYAALGATVSSHLNLLTTEGVSDSRLSTKSALVTLDLTPHAEFRSLLPNYYLDVESNLVQRFYPRDSNDNSEEYAASRLAEIEILAHRYIDAYARSFGGLALSVTGGQDSRLMLALSRAHGARIEGFTYGSPDKDSLKRGGYWAESMQLDHDIVHTLLPHLKLRKHHFIDVTPYNSGELDSPLSSDELSLVRSNTWAAHGQYLVGVYRQLFEGGDWAHLRASGVEIGRRARTPQVDTFDAFLRKHSSNDVHGNDVREAGHRLQYDNDFHGYSRWDLAYWEIRMGKWHAEMMNEHDAAFSSFVPIGARRILDLLLSFTPEQRRGAFAVKELINRAAPLMNFFGTNDRRNLYEQIRDDKQNAYLRDDDAASVFTSLSVYAPSGALQHRQTGSTSEIYLGSRFFAEGARVRGELFRASTVGDLRMVIDNPYERPQGVGSFEWRVLLDDRVVVRGDGAQSGAPVTVSIVGLRPAQRVSFELLARKPRSAPSWQAATVTRVRELDFAPRSSDRARAGHVGCDSPFAEVTQPDLPPTR